MKTKIKWVLNIFVVLYCYEKKIQKQAPWTNLSRMNQVPFSPDDVSITVSIRTILLISTWILNTWMHIKVSIKFGQDRKQN